MTTIYLFLAMLFFALTSCDKQEKEELPPVKTTLRINTNLETTFTRSMPLGTEIGLFITKGDLGDVYDNNSTHNNVKAVLSSSGWTLTPEVYLSNNNATIYAYAPYDASIPDAGSIGVDVTSCKLDYCVGKSVGTINNASPSASLVMFHVLTKIRFKVFKSTYTGAGKITEICINSVMSKVISITGILNISSGVITPAYSALPFVKFGNSAGLYTLTSDVPTDEEAAVLDFMIIPIFFREREVEVKITVDGKVYTYVLPSTSWGMSKLNTYTLSLASKGLKDSGLVVAMTNWDGGENATGELK